MNSADSSFASGYDRSRDHYGKLLGSLEHVPDSEKIERIREFLKSSPDLAEAHNDLGVLYYRTGEKLLALGHHEKAVRLSPGNMTFRKNLAGFYFVEMGWTDDAIEIFTDILKSNPADTETLTSLGIISRALDLTDEAGIFFKRVTELEPWNRDARDALASLTAAKPLHAPHPPVEEERPQPYTVADIDAILAQVGKTGRTPAPKTPEEHYAAAVTLAEEGKLEDAVSALETLLRNRPGDPVIHNDLGVLYQKLGNPLKSLEHHEMAVARSPRDPLFLKNLASLYYAELGRTDDAIGLYLQLLKEHPEDTDVLGALAMISAANNRPAEAAVFLKRILHLEPANESARTLLAHLVPDDSGNFFLARSQGMETGRIPKN